MPVTEIVVLQRLAEELDHALLGLFLDLADTAHFRIFLSSALQAIGSLWL